MCEARQLGAFTGIVGLVANIGIDQPVFNSRFVAESELTSKLASSDQLVRVNRLAFC